MTEIDADWGEIRSIPRTTSLGEDAGLLDAWRDVRNLPEFFYHVVQGVGLDYMAILKVRCMGAFRRENRKGGPAYRGVVEEVLWGGPRYQVRQEEQGKQYAYSKKNCDLTLEEAVARFDGYRQEYLRASRDRICRWEESIAELQKSIITEKNRNAKAEVLDVLLEIKIRGSQ